MADYPKGAVSHSQISSYVRCSKQFELERISKYPAPPTWYFIGGNAVHAATEFLDKHWGQNIGDVTPENIVDAWTAEFNREIDDAFLAWPDDDEWLKFGRRGSEQGYAYWFAHGLAGVEAYIVWRQAHPELVLISIEERFDIELGGAGPRDSVILTGRIDRVFRDPQGLIVVDLKSGTKRPTSALQLGMYALGYNRSHEALEGASVARGGYLMTKDGELYLQDLTPFTPELIHGMVVAYLEGVEHDVFLPNIGNTCFSCPMSRACAAYSGRTPEAIQYDSLLRS